MGSNIPLEIEQTVGVRIVKVTSPPGAVNRKNSPLLGDGLAVGGLMSRLTVASVSFGPSTVMLCDCFEMLISAVAVGAGA